MVPRWRTTSVCNALLVPKVFKCPCQHIQSCMSSSSSCIVSPPHCYFFLSRSWPVTSASPTASSGSASWMLTLRLFSNMVTSWVLESCMASLPAWWLAVPGSPSLRASIKRLAQLRRWDPSVLIYISLFIYIKSPVWNCIGCGWYYDGQNRYTVCLWWWSFFPRLLVAADKYLMRNWSPNCH